MIIKNRGLKPLIDGYCEPYPWGSYFAFLQYFTVNSISGNGKISFSRQCGIWRGYLQQMILVCHSGIII